MAQSGLGKSKARDAPPALFLHPSPSASHASLSGPMAPSGVPPSTSTTLQPPAPPAVAAVSPGHQGSTASAPAIGRGPGGSLLRSAGGGGTSGGGGDAGSLGGTNTHNTQPSAAVLGPIPGLNISIPISLRRGESTRATDRTDALWAEMQATLEEVELSASGGTRVFGPDHDRKLADLRAAQIALAQAWARSEADDAIETVGGSNIRPTAAGTDAATDGAGKADVTATAGTDGGGAKSTVGSGSARPGSSGAGAGGQERLGEKLEEEADADIFLARKRREANDRYFERVNRGVLDVVAKLEEVATAMRAVEQESKDIWGDGENESSPGSAKT